MLYYFVNFSMNRTAADMILKSMHSHKWAQFESRESQIHFAN